MFLEVLDYSLDPNQPKTKMSYKTQLSSHLHHEATLGLKLKIDWLLQEWELGDLLFSLHDKTITTTRIFPFWKWILYSDTWVRFEKDSWRSMLLWKWIAWAIEWLILYRFRELWKDFIVQRDYFDSALRTKQLSRYGLSFWESLNTYMNALHMSLYSPHFSVVRFPSWVTDPEILQLREKV